MCVDDITISTHGITELNYYAGREANGISSVICQTTQRNGIAQTKKTIGVINVLFFRYLGS